MKYPYIYAYCQAMGSHKYFYDLQVRRAEEDNQPEEVCYFTAPLNPKTGEYGERTWHSFAAMRDPLRSKIERACENPMPLADMSEVP